jgi:hypothetical protein
MCMLQRINVPDFSSLTAHVLSAILHEPSPPVFRYLTLKYAQYMLASDAKVRCWHMVSTKSCTRSESLNKPPIFFWHSPHPLVQIGVLRSAGVGARTQPLTIWRISKEKQTSGTSLPSQSYVDCTSTYSDHRIRRVYQSNATRRHPGCNYTFFCSLWVPFLNLATVRTF